MCHTAMEDTDNYFCVPVPLSLRGVACVPTLFWQIKVHNLLAVLFILRCPYSRRLALLELVPNLDNSYGLLVQGIRVCTTMYTVHIFVQFSWANRRSVHKLPPNHYPMCQCVPYQFVT